MTGYTFLLMHGMEQLVNTVNINYFFTSRVSKPGFVSIYLAFQYCIPLHHNTKLFVIPH